MGEGTRFSGPAPILKNFLKNAYIGFILLLNRFTKTVYPKAKSVT
jgi:hypothetical protein